MSAGCATTISPALRVWGGRAQKPAVKNPTVLALPMGSVCDIISSEINGNSRIGIRLKTPIALAVPLDLDAL
jgi:hypothetical protein